MEPFHFGFRIVGNIAEERRPIIWGDAFLAYAECDPRANVKSEAYLSAFRFGSEFRQHLETTGSTRGYSGPCWSSYVWFDIDREGDLELATQDARRLTAGMMELLAIDGDEMAIWFSGGKGYHVGLPTAMWNPEPSTDFHLVMRRFAETVAAHCHVKIDTGIYDRVRAFRAPNSRHPKSGLYKRHVTFDELCSLTTKAIVNLASTPAPFDLIDQVDHSDKAESLWREASEQHQRAAAAVKVRRANGHATLNRQTLEFIRDGAEEGDRHRLLFSAAANLAEFGCPAALAHALLTEPALDSGLPSKDVRRQIEHGLNYQPKGAKHDGSE